jgi:FemAB-related protein (PEP-CTERM system-associated)
MVTPDNDIAVRLASHKDQKRWDAYVLAHPEASPYHLFAWKLAVEESYRHKCPYLYGESKGRVVGVLPLVHIRFLGVVNELAALPYCDVGNCLSDCGPVQDALLEEALKLRGLLRGRKVSLRGSLKETNLKNSFLRIEKTEKVRMLLELPSSSTELFAGFKSKLRSQIHKAEKNGISFTWGGLDDLEEIYDVFSRNMHDLGSPVHAKVWLRSIITHYSQRIKVGVARFGGKTVGVGILLLGGDSVSIPWASTLRGYNHLGPNMLLYWKMLEYSSNNNFKYFDFGRSSEHEGTYRFKKQWGAKPVPLEWYTLAETYRDRSIQTSSRSATRAVVSALWRKTPLALANSVGPFLRKYISL